MSRDYWKGRRVLLTGHTGFVGAWMSALLTYHGAEVTGFSLKEEENSLYDKIKDRLCIKSVYGDLRNREEIFSCVKGVNPEVVFHIAAFGFIKECLEDSQRAFTTNVNGTYNLLDAINYQGIQCRIIVASSDKVYRNNDLKAYLFSEEDSLGGIDPYSASKTCEDILAQSYFKTYLDEKGYSLCVVRPSNILGGGDHNISRLIPSIYYNLGRGEKPEIRNPNSMRPWQNILDVCDAYLKLAVACERGEHIYNVGPEPEGIKTTGEIAEYISNLYGVGYNVDTGCPEKTIEHEYLGLSIEKIKAEHHWRPKRKLEQTLEEIKYFYQNDNGTNTFDLCSKLISKYYNGQEEEK